MSDSERDSEEETDTPQTNGIPASIILINAFDLKSHNLPQVAHASTCHLMRYYLRTMSSQLIGVTFYGTDTQTTGSTVFNINCVTDMFPLSPLSIENYKKLEDADVAKIPQSKELILSDVFTHCRFMFSNCKRTLSSRTIFILSSFDVIPREKQEQISTLEEVRHLVDLGIEIRLINISPSQYKPDPFYKQLLQEANNGQLFVKIPEPVWSSKMILQQMIAVSDRYLTVSKLKFDIGNEMSIGVGLYKLLKGCNQTKLKTQYVDSDTNELLSCVSTTMKKSLPQSEGEMHEKAMPIIQTEILRCQEFGGKTIEVTENEFKSIRNIFGGTMLKLLGFKSNDKICKEKWFLKTCFFLFPNECNIVGSTVAFKALHQACQESKVVALCVLCTRVNAKPLIVALSPCANPLGLDIPIGFDVIPLPFVENIRDLPVIENDEDTKISVQQREIMNSVIDNLNFEYQPDMFEDPKLQTLLNIIEEKALDHSNVKFSDTTLHDDTFFENIDNERFYELFGPFNAVPSKRPATSKGAAGNVKKEKLENINEELLSYRVRNNELGKYTVNELKQILQFKNISEALTGLKKQNLLDLVNKYASTWAD